MTINTITPEAEDATLLDGIDPGLAADFAAPSRRDLFRRSALALGAAASTPVVLGVTARQAYAQGLPKQITDVLNFALTLEYLEDEFYRTGLGTRGLIPGRARPTYQTISRHEAAHVRFLAGALGGAAVAKPKFDFTAGGKYADVFSNYETFATLSQTFEDLGVAAYKGQAGNLMGSGKLLTAALRIHSVEARHAAQVRSLRGILPWNGPFDEPLSKGQVLAAAKPFIASM